MYGLTTEQIIKLRLKCLEPFVVVASKAGIEQDTVIRKAEVAWEYATKGLGADKSKSPEKPLTRKRRP